MLGPLNVRFLTLLCLNDVPTSLLENKNIKLSLKGTKTSYNLLSL
jgi:hypothetical protein